MRTNQITFERLEADYGIGRIRGVDVNHERQLITVVCDSDVPESIAPHVEGATVPGNMVFTTTGPFPGIDAMQAIVDEVGVCLIHGLPLPCAAEHGQPLPYGGA